MARTQASLTDPTSPDEIEQQFYEALQSGNIEQLMGVWADDDEIVCVHPGGGRCVGTAAIRASFEALFSQGVVDARPEKVRRLRSPGCALHSVLERVPVATESGPRSAWVIATNVFVETARGWRLAAHHASPGSPLELLEHDEPTSVLH
jgi:uncharacterized protein (TIGR02246 family)